MKRDHINYSLVGLFVLMSMTFLVAGLMRITGHGLPTDTYYVVYKNITGIDKGTEVTYGGFRIGQVQEILPVNTNGVTNFKLILNVKSGWPIPDDSIAHITMPGFLADNIIDIKEGSRNTKLNPGAGIRSREPRNFMAQLEAVANEIKELSSKSIRPLVANIDHQINTLSGEFQGNMEHVTDNIDNLISEYRNSAIQLSKLFGNNNQRHFSNLIKNADQFAGNLLELSSGFNKATEQLDIFLKNSNELLIGNNDDIRKSVVELRTSLDTVSQNINSIVYNLETSSRNMNEFSRQIRQNPGVILMGKPPKDKSGLQ